MLRRLLSSNHLHSLRFFSNPIPISSFTATDSLHFHSLRLFSTSGNDNSDDPEDTWKISPESDDSKSSIFSSVAAEDDPFRSDPAQSNHDVFASLKRETPKPEKVDIRQNGVKMIEKKTERKEKVLMKTFKDEEYDPWSIVEPDNEKEDLFQSIDKVELGLNQNEVQNIDKDAEKEEELDIEELKRREKELMKTLEGRRKCSVAHVWIQPGEGRFKVNEKETDVYCPIMDCRAELLRPFTVTVSLGKWDVRCTVKGGGVSDVRSETYAAVKLALTKDKVLQLVGSRHFNLLLHFRALKDSIWP